MNLDIYIESISMSKFQILLNEEGDIYKIKIAQEMQTIDSRAIKDGIINTANARRGWQNSHDRVPRFRMKLNLAPRVVRRIKWRLKCQRRIPLNVATIFLQELVVCKKDDGERRNSSAKS